VAAPATVEREAPAGDNERLSGSACLDGERHVNRWARGWAGDVARFAPDCERPYRQVCLVCRSYLVLPCERGNEDHCAPCAGRYRRNVQRVALTGTGVDVDALELAIGDDGDPEQLVDLARLRDEQGVFTTLVLTVTAQGDRRHRDLTKPGAPWCPCTPAGGVDLAQWNGGIGNRWSRMLETLRRSGLLGEDVEYFRAVEVQDGKRRRDGRGRMALHEHVIIRAKGVVRLDAALVEALRDIAMHHGYGHELRIERPAVSRDGRARLAAWYAAKYVSKATTVRTEVPWRREYLGNKHSVAEVVDRETGEVRQVARVEERWTPRTYLTWTASRGWGASMKSVKTAQRVWAQAAAGGVVTLSSTESPNHSTPGPGECPSPEP
jgi:hypothetical protein